MDSIVLPKHMRAAGLCVHGSRDFARRYGLDWKKFVREGIPAEQLIATGDAMAKKAIEVACGER